MAHLDSTVATLLQDDIPEEYICPITQDFMKDPVIAEDGHTYERDALYAWLSKHGTSPITREYISSDRLLGDPTLKKMIEDFVKEKQKQMLEKQLEDAAASGKDKERIRNSSSEEEEVEVEEIKSLGQNATTKLMLKDREERVPLILGGDARDDHRKVRQMGDQKKKRLQASWEADKRKHAHRGPGGRGRSAEKRMHEIEIKTRPTSSSTCWSCTLY